MNKLLPEIEELFPISDTRKTFSETPLTKDFELLCFKDKLQVLNDIVRQTMMYDNIPNPENDVESLIGDSYTASLASIEYMKKNGIGKNHRSVLARKRSFDPEDITTTHILTLVDDNNGETYQFDCSPYVGFKCGKVEGLTNERFYEEYVEICGDVQAILNSMRLFAYKIQNERLTEKELNSFLQMLNDAGEYEILNGFVSFCHELLYQKDYSDTVDKDKTFRTINKYNPYSLRFGEKDKINMKNNKSLEQIKLWREELNELIPTDTDYQRQLELAQAIVQELTLIDPSFEKTLELDGEKISFSHISPRLFYEKGLNVVLLKPSSFKLGVSATIRESFLHKGNGAIGEYHPNVGAPSELTGIKPMRMFHPHGYKYERSMDGPGDLFLVQELASDILITKRKLRKELGKYVANQEVMWYDGNTIVWDPIITNLVHTTDDASEASMHYLSAYPEYQLMTRFMYPNPRLVKEKRK